MNKFAVLLLIPLFSLTACDLDSSSSVAPNLAEAKRLVEENYAEWKYYQQQNYMFKLGHIGQVGCGDTALGELPDVQVVVREGLVDSVTYADESDPFFYGQDYPLVGADYIGTIDHIFEWVLEEIDNKPQIIGRWYGAEFRREPPAFNENFNHIEQFFLKRNNDAGCWSIALSIYDFQ